VSEWVSLLCAALPAVALCSLHARTMARVDAQTRTPIGRRRNEATSLVHVHRADQWESCKATQIPTHVPDVLAILCAGHQPIDEIERRTAHLGASIRVHLAVAVRAACERAKFVTGFSRWIKGRLKGCVQAVSSCGSNKLDSRTCTAPHLALARGVPAAAA
jgi:hypothetical protein